MFGEETGPFSRQAVILLDKHFRHVNRFKEDIASLKRKPFFSNKILKQSMPESFITTSYLSACTTYSSAMNEPMWINGRVFSASCEASNAS